MIDGDEDEEGGGLKKTTMRMLEETRKAPSKAKGETGSTVKIACQINPKTTSDILMALADADFSRCMPTVMAAWLNVPTTPPMNNKKIARQEKSCQ